MKYVMDRSGIGKMLRSHPGIQRQVYQAARKTLAIARGGINNQSYELSKSGRIEDGGVQRVMRGDPRMKVFVVFHSRYAMDHEKRTGFLSGSIKGRRR